MGCNATGATPGGCTDSCIPTASPVVKIKPGTLRLSVPFGAFLAGIWSNAKTFDADGVAGAAGGVAVCALMAPPITVKTPIPKLVTHRVIRLMPQS